MAINLVRHSVCAIVLFFSLASVAKTSPAECRHQLTEKYRHSWQSLRQHYQYVDADFENWNSEVAPRFLNPQSQKVYYVLHGFMGTPAEMMIYEKQALAENAAILNDIIPGFGASARIANHFDSADWIATTTRHLTWLQNCYAEIHLVGFSTGALLLHLASSLEPKNIHSLKLISPYYKPAITQLEFLAKNLDFITLNPQVETIYRYTGFPDLKVMTVKPQWYLQEIPVATASRIAQLGDLVYDKLKDRAPSKIPTKVFYSESDRTASYEVGIKLLEKTQSQLEL
ncbi:MAG: hypothetical protein ACLGGX_12570, partial [Bdellovibrionia bacterium]